MTTPQELQNGRLRDGSEIPEQPGTKVLTVVEGTDVETALVKSEPWSREQVQLVKTTICKNAELSDNEAHLFIAQCQRLGLDPVMGQVYAIKRKGKLNIQIGIDGYRKIADRTGKYAGNSDPVFEKHSAATDKAYEHYPQKATVVITKLVAGEPCKFPASARWSEYFPTDKRDQWMWVKMPYTMLGKCAEALALRKAFPAELGGFYIPEEMDQVGTEGQEDTRGGNGSQERSQDQEPASWAAARARGGPDAIELPWGNDKGAPIGALSTDHLGRLLKWIRSSDREPDFAQRSHDLIVGMENVLEERRQGDVDPATGEVSGGDTGAITSPPREPGE